MKGLAQVRFNNPQQDSWAQQVNALLRTIQQRSATQQNITYITRSTGGTGSSSEPTSGGEAETQTTPQALTATGSFSAIVLTWTAPTDYEGHAVTEVYRSSSDNFGTAEQIAETAFNIYSDPVGPGATFYYWIRFRNSDDATGPLNQTAGTKGETHQSLSNLFALLEGKITQDYLSSNLSTSIDLIATLDAARTQLREDVDGLAATSAYLQQYEADLRARVQLDTEQTAYAFTQMFEGAYQQLATTEEAFAQEGNILGNARILENEVRSPETGLAATRATLINDYYTKTSADAAVSQAVQSLSAKIFDADGSTLLDAHINAMDQAIVGDGQALSTRFIAMHGAVYDGTTGLAKTRADLLQEQTTRSEEDEALSQQILSLQAKMFNADGSTLASAFVNKMDSALVSPGTAVAQALEDLDTQVGAVSATLTNDYYTKVTTESAISQRLSTHTITLDGTVNTLAGWASIGFDANTAFNAQWGVKSTVNGIQNGIGLYNDGVNTSVLLQAGKIGLLSPIDGSVNDLFAIIQGDPDIPDGVYVDTAFIKAASIKDLVAGEVVADSVVAASSITSPTITGGLFSGGQYYATAGAYTLDMLPSSTLPIWYGPSSASKTAANANFAVSTSGGVNIRGLTLRDENGVVRMNANGLDPAFIDNLIVDTLQIGANAVTVPMYLSSAALSGVSRTVLDHSYEQGQAGTVMFSLVLDAQRDGDASGSYDSIDITVRIYDGATLKETISHNDVFADAPGSASPRLLYPLVGAVDVNSSTVRIKVTVTSNVATQSYTTFIKGYIVSAKR